MSVGSPPVPDARTLVKRFEEFEQKAFQLGKSEDIGRVLGKASIVLKNTLKTVGQAGNEMGDAATAFQLEMITNKKRNSELNNLIAGFCELVALAARSFHSQRLRKEREIPIAKKETVSVGVNTGEREMSPLSRHLYEASMSTGGCLSGESTNGTSRVKDEPLDEDEFNTNARPVDDSTPEFSFSLQHMNGIEEVKAEEEDPIEEPPQPNHLLTGAFGPVPTTGTTSTRKRQLGETTFNDDVIRHYNLTKRLLMDKNLPSLSMEKKNPSDPDPIYQCAQCNSTFSSYTNLQRHSDIHLEYRPYKCDLCDRSFPFESHLLDHMKRHSGSGIRKNKAISEKKRHQCDQCEWSFDRPKKLELHRLCHSGERPHKCPECAVRFQTTSMLNNHLRKEHGLRPYKCTVCEADFEKWMEMINHKKAAHSVEQPTADKDSD